MAQEQRPFDGVNLDVTLSPQSNRANLLSSAEDLPVQMGKLQKLYGYVPYAIDIDVPLNPAASYVATTTCEGLDLDQLGHTMFVITVHDANRLPMNQTVPNVVRLNLPSGGTLDLNLTDTALNDIYVRDLKYPTIFYSDEGYTAGSTTSINCFTPDAPGRPVYCGEFTSTTYDSGVGRVLSCSDAPGTPADGSIFVVTKPSGYSFQYFSINKTTAPKSAILNMNGGVVGHTGIPDDRPVILVKLGTYTPAGGQEQYVRYFILSQDKNVVHSDFYGEPATNYLAAYNGRSRDIAPASLTTSTEYIPVLADNTNTNPISNITAWDAGSAPSLTYAAEASSKITSIANGISSISCSNGKVTVALTPAVVASDTSPSKITAWSAGSVPSLTYTNYTLPGIAMLELTYVNGWEYYNYSS